MPRTAEQAAIASLQKPGYTAGNRYAVRSGHFGRRLTGCRGVRCVFSESRRQVRLGNGGLPGPHSGVLPAVAQHAPSDHEIPDRQPSENREPPRWGALTHVLRSCSGGLQTAAADLLHAALPSDCRVCGSPMLGWSPVRICQVCVERVRSQAETPELLCSRCGDALGMESARFAVSMGTHECTACRVNPPAFARAVAFGTYDDEMREMLHALKFQGMQRVARYVFGRWLAEAVLKLQDEAASDLVVVPVPLFREREQQRGFNQAKLLAQAGLERLKQLRPAWRLELRPEALLRVRDTRALYELRPDQRRRNLEGAFRIGEANLVRDREVLLVDDIFTTGAMANACARVLLRSGATKVWVVTVARAQPESVRAVTESFARWDGTEQQSSIGREM